MLKQVKINITAAAAPVKIPLPKAKIDVVRESGFAVRYRQG